MVTKRHSLTQRFHLNFLLCSSGHNGIKSEINCKSFEFEVFSMCIMVGSLERRKTLQQWRVICDLIENKFKKEKKMKTLKEKLFFRGSEKSMSTAMIDEFFVYRYACVCCSILHVLNMLVGASSNELLTIINYVSSHFKNTLACSSKFMLTLVIVM